MADGVRIVFFGQEPYKASKGGIGSYINHRAFLLSANGFDVWWSNEHEYAHFNPFESTWDSPIALPKQSFLNKILAKFFIFFASYWKNINSNIKAELIEFPDGLSCILPPKRKIKVVLQCHISYSVRYFLSKTRLGLLAKIYNRIKVFLQRIVLRQVDSIIACSAEIALLESGFYKLHPDNFRIIPHYFSPLAEPFLKDPSGNYKNYYLVIGNFEYLKGFDLVLAGFESYYKNGGKCRLKFAGNKGWADKQFESEWGDNEIIKEFRRSAANNFVDFYGTLAKDELANLRAGAMAVIIPSRFEAFTMVAGECFLSGTPVILSDRTGWVRLAEKFKAAYVVNFYNTFESALAMKQMEDENARNSFVTGGHKLAEYISGDSLVSQTIDLYMSFVKSP